MLFCFPIFCIFNINLVYYLIKFCYFYRKVSCLLKQFYRNILKRLVSSKQDEDIPRL